MEVGSDDCIGCGEVIKGLGAVSKVVPVGFPVEVAYLQKAEVFLESRVTETLGTDFNLLQQNLFKAYPSAPCLRLPYEDFLKFIILRVPMVGFLLQHRPLCESPAFRARSFWMGSRTTLPRYTI